MLQKEKIFVAGHRGLIGSAILRKLQMFGFPNIVVADRKALDLSDQRAVFEFIASEASIFLLSEVENFWERLFQPGTPPIINVGSGSGITIMELAEKIKKTVGYQGELHYDLSMPDGVSQKILDISRISQLSWAGPSIGLEVGLEIAYQDYLERFGEF